MDIDNGVDSYVMSFMMHRAMWRYKQSNIAIAQFSSEVIETRNLSDRLGFISWESPPILFFGH